MARPKKYPTKVVRINANDLFKIKKLAKKRNMSVPDYLNWRLSK